MANVFRSCVSFDTSCPFFFWMVISECPLWVINGHVQCIQGDVRFTPKPDMACIGDVRFVPIADIGRLIVLAGAREHGGRHG